MLQALTTKFVFIFKGLVCNNSYILNLERFNVILWGTDKAEITTIWLLANRCASAKKKTPTMEILPDKKELIMKGGTFQEQLSAFQ